MHIPDRQKQRREYVKKITGKYSLLAVGGLAVLPIAFVTILLSFMTVACFGSFVYFRDWSNLPGIFFFGFLSAFGWYVSWVLFQALVKGTKAARAVTYVPSMTSTTLPADEVLVRASQEPTEEQSTVLLRAAGERAETPEHLLRASIGGNDT